MDHKLKTFLKRAGTASELANELYHLGDHNDRDRALSLSPPKTPGRLNRPPASPKAGSSRSPLSDSKSAVSQGGSRSMVVQKDMAKYRPPLQHSQPGGSRKKAPAFRRLGQPGAKDDVLSKGMSGAARKWYCRYLDEGIEPSEASRLALARKTARYPARSQQGPSSRPEARPRLAPGKREISRETPPEQQSKRIKRQQEHAPHQRGQRLPPRDSRKVLPGTSSLTPAVCPPPVDYAEVRVVKVGIAHANFPDTLLSKEDMEKLENTIAGRIHLGWRTLINMVGIHYRSGHFIVDCWDDDTVEWLSLTAPEVGRELGIPLVVLKGDDIPKEATMSIWLPKAHLMSEEVTLGTIQGSNPLDTKSWRIVKCAISGPGRILVAKISPSEQAKIAARGHKITFRFKRLDVHGLKGSISQEAKPEMETETSAVEGPQPKGISGSEQPAVISEGSEPMATEDIPPSAGLVETAKAGLPMDDCGQSGSDDGEMDHDRIV